MRRLTTALLILGIVFGSTAASCRGIVVNQPTQTEVDKVREGTIKISDALTTSLGIYDSALKFADAQNIAGQFSTATLRDLAEIGKSFSAVAHKALDELAALGTNPNLATTAARVVNALDPLIVKLETSGNDGLKAFGISLRVLLGVLQTYVVGGV